MVILGGIFYFLKLKNFSPGSKLPAVIVELREEGFYPEEITILKGQNVIFKTNRGKIFWPASNLHPSHEIYPEFDPQEPIEGDKTWSFRFDKIGVWKYHDHLAPYYRGIVNVVLVKEESVGRAGEPPEGQIKLSNCDKIKNDDSKLKQCWDDFIKDTVQTKGMNYAMEILTELYANPLFAKDCHSYTHTIGGEAYLEFKKNHEIYISPATNFCGFGFYHGFMEMLFAKGGDIQTARDLCGYVDKKAGNPWNSTNGACFHGIGHGVVDGSNKQDWGNAQALTSPGLELCDKVAVTDQEHFRCYGGTFNSIAIAFSNKLYGLTTPQDPLKFCTEQKEQYKRACYGEVGAPGTMRLFSNDLKKVAKVFETIQEDAYAEEAIRNAMGFKILEFMTGKSTDDLKQIAKICTSIATRLKKGCIEGFGASLVEFGPPDKEYIKPLEFCGNSFFNKEEQAICFKEAIGALRVSKSKEKFNIICDKVEKILGEEWKNFCLQNTKK